jgi:hypothetical protein
MTKHQNQNFNIVVHYKRLENLEDALYLHALGQKSDVGALGLD